jgi:hypothetical protein
MPEKKQEPSQKDLTQQRVEGFQSIYANSVVFEPSAWDLKLIFGQLDQSVDPAATRQTVSVTISWQQAKLALFWLKVQVQAMEDQLKTKIPIREDIQPAPLPAMTAEQKKNPEARKFYDWYAKARKEFLDSLK